MRGQKQVRAPVLEIEERGDAGGHAFGVVVAPLGRGQRPHLSRCRDQVPGEYHTLAIHFAEEADRAHRMARRWNHPQDVIARMDAGVIRQRARNRDILEQRKAILPVVVVVGDRPSLPVCAHPSDQVLLDQRDPDPDPGFNRSLQALNLIAVVVGDVDIGDAVDADRAQLIEHVTGAKVDGDRLVAAAQQVDIAGVLKHQDVLGNRMNEGLRLG